ncbi:hypothetical protein [Pseudoxanthomonas sacheonensis]|uniref:Uncharacterized protein n=1 Tax=Pseudoxanthomonas sacheonensis TaxID=443615 RepID=A0ABU1RRQ5_9GAMM|nr:hypothetical protein [Pseudoxanthomonas sacheonensis]MDR6841466.1 hypothetical protein [Pseudoxanthomonas sacheonensis]
MKIHRVISAVFLAAAAIPASATSTMCAFEGSSGSSSYSIEFIGYGEIGAILMSLPRGPRSLPAGSYKVLEFDERKSKINLAYRNPGDPSLPPSFTLEGIGNNVRMTIGKERIVGKLHCDF